MKKDINLLQIGSETTTFSLVWDPKRAPLQGKNKLTQDIVKGILTLKGSNLYDPGYGERFYSLFGVVDINSAEEVKELFPVLVDSLEEHIKEKQAKDNTLVDSERLSSIELQSVDFEPTLTAWVIKLKINTADLVSVTLTI